MNRWNQKVHEGSRLAGQTGVLACRWCAWVRESVHENNRHENHNNTVRRSGGRHLDVQDDAKEDHQRLHAAGLRAFLVSATDSPNFENRAARQGGR